MIENYCHPAWTFRPARKAKRSLILGFGRNDLEFATNQNWFDPELGKTVILRCLLVPSDLNLFLGNNRSRRGKYLIGASWHKKDRRFRSRIYVNNQQTHLGNFEDEMSAHLRWREEKIKLANQFELLNWWSKTRCDLVRRRLRKLIRMMR